MRFSTKTRVASLAVVMGSCLIGGLAAAGSAQTNETDKITSVDQQFFQQAGKGNQEELNDARSEQNSSNRYVAMYARRMMKDHLTAASQLGALAKQYGVSVPGENMTMQDQPTYDASDQGSPPPNAPNTKTHMGPMMNGKAYMQKEVSDHQQMIALFQGEAKNGGTGAMRAFAQSTIPILQTHLQMAQQFVSSGRITPMPNPTIAPNSPP